LHLANHASRFGSASFSFAKKAAAPSGLVSRVKKLRESLVGAGIARHVAALGHEMEPEDRREVAAEIARLRDVLDRLSKAIRG
jgi:hypothetical protein